MTCKDCLYYEGCPLGLAIQGKTGTCLKFKNKADFVEVVRCKNCTYRERTTINAKGFEICPASGMEITDNDYCSYGERK